MQKENITKHKEYQNLALKVYKANKNYPTKDWIELNHFENKNSGFYASAFIKNNEIVISIRGTDDNKDTTNADVSLFLGQIPNQFYDAKNFYKKIQKDNPNTKITFVGHSLGGSLSQLMSNETGCDAVTFSPYGVGNIVGLKRNKKANIVNYGNENDLIYIKNIDNQLGKSFIVKENEILSDKVIKEKGHRKPFNIKYHKIETFGDIANAKEYTPATLHFNNDLKTPFLKAGVSYDVEFPHFDIKQIYTIEEIDKMSSNEFTKKEAQIFDQLKNYGIPTEKQAQEEVKSGNLIWVDSYKRDDGTQVKGYYRKRAKI